MKKRSGVLKKPKEEVENHLRLTHNDPDREQELPPNTKVQSQPEPTEPFDVGLPKLIELQEVLKKARTASPQGPNEIPYRIYKNCPKLQRRLLALFKVVWRRGKWLTAG